MAEFTRFDPNDGTPGEDNLFDYPDLALKFLLITFGLSQVSFEHARLVWEISRSVRMRSEAAFREKLTNFGKATDRTGTVIDFCRLAAERILGSLPEPIYEAQWRTLNAALRDLDAEAMPDDQHFPSWRMTASWLKLRERFSRTISLLAELGYQSHKDAV